MVALDEKVSYLEDILQKVAYSQFETNMSLNRLSNEMREFKDEMREFKDEMREFKDEMREFKDEMSEFKDEMSDYKDWSKKQIISMNRQWGDLANKLGTVVEDIVAPNIPRIAKVYFGCPEVDYIAVRVKKRSVTDRSRRREFDAIAVCEKIFILNETKSSPETRDVDKLAEFVQSGELFDYFPEYKGYRICPVFSSLYLDDAFVAYLSRKGVYALTMKDDTMEIVNFDALGVGPE
jgi:Sec-independent protein translocase protein TatA